MSEKNKATFSNPICKDKRMCFGRIEKECRILLESYEDGKCPFCKRHRED